MPATCRENSPGPPRGSRLSMCGFSHFAKVRASTEVSQQRGCVATSQVSFNPGRIGNAIGVALFGMLM
jgi:hypothetical protein